MRSIIEFVRERIKWGNYINTCVQQFCVILSMCLYIRTCSTLAGNTFQRPESGYMVGVKKSSHLPFVHSAVTENGNGKIKMKWEYVRNGPFRSSPI